jgi:hypothetical protein
VRVLDQRGDRRRQRRQLGAPGTQRRAPLGLLALEHLVGHVVVEVGPRRRRQVDDHGDRQHRHEDAEHDAGDQHQRQQHHVERRQERVGDQRPVVLAATVRAPLGHRLRRTS